MPRPERKWPSPEEEQLNLFGLGEVESERVKDNETFLAAKPHVEIRLQPNPSKELFAVTPADFEQVPRRETISDRHRHRIPVDRLHAGRDKGEESQIRGPLLPNSHADDRQKGAMARYCRAGYDGATDVCRVCDLRARRRCAARAKKIPTTIVIVGHYTRADIPAFSGEHQWWTRLSNVRNSLVTAAVPIRLRIYFGADDDKKHRRAKDLPEQIPNSWPPPAGRAWRNSESW